MRKILLLLIVTLGLVFSATAQRKPTKVIDNKGTIKQVLDSSSHFIDTAYNGITKIGDSTLVLGGKLVQVTTLDINGQKLQLANLVSGAGTDSLVVADPTSGELKRISSSRLLNNLNAKNGIRKDADSIKLGGPLTEPTTITASPTNSLTLANGALGGIKITGLTSGAGTDSILVIDPATNNLRYVSKSTLLTGLFAKNGLTKSADSVLLGGNLDRATTIGTSATNTLSLTGLQSGNKAVDSIMLVTPAGVIKQTSAASFKTLAGNGLSNGASGDSVILGGTLDRNTILATGGKNFKIAVGAAAGDSLNITGLTSGNTSTDSILVVNGTTGRVKQVAATSLLQSGENSFTATANQTVYTVPNMPATPSKVWVYRNGAKLVGGSASTVTSDYTVSAGTLTLVLNGYAVVAGDVIEVQWVK